MIYENGQWYTDESLYIRQTFRRCGSTNIQSVRYEIIDGKMVKIVKNISVVEIDEKTGEPICRSE